MHFDPSVDAFYRQEIAGQHKKKEPPSRTTHRKWKARGDGPFQGHGAMLRVRLGTTVVNISLKTDFFPSTSSINR